jgi:hypothetical protein
MAPKSWYWDAFFQGNKKFKKNGSNLESYCQGCVNYHSQNLVQANQRAVTDGAHLGTVSSKEDICKAGVNYFLDECMHLLS